MGWNSSITIAVTFNLVKDALHAGSPSVAISEKNKNSDILVMVVCFLHFFCCIRKPSGKDNRFHMADTIINMRRTYRHGVNFRQKYKFLGDMASHNVNIFLIGVLSLHVCDPYSPLLRSCYLGVKILMLHTRQHSESGFRILVN
jgi:hypothetical protein